MTRTSGPYKRRAPLSHYSGHSPEPGQERASVPGNQSEWAQLGAAHVLLFRARWLK